MSTMSSYMEEIIKRFRPWISQAISGFYIAFASFFPLLTLEKRDLSGKTAIVTGANSGLGYSIALSLAEQHATVYLACRNRSKGDEAATNIINATGSKTVHVVELDTSSLESVRRFASSWSKPIDMLMHNAGIATTPSHVKTTSDGLGLIYVTNLLGSFLLTSLLETRLADDARVVFTASTGAYFGDIDMVLRTPRLVNTEKPDSLVYSDTKMMQIAFARALQDRWNGLGQKRKAYAFTPGYSMTPIFSKLPEDVRVTDYPFYLLQIGTKLAVSSDQGALTGVWLASSNDPRTEQGGGFWDRKQRMYTSVDTMTREHLEQIWQTWCHDSGAQWD